jgi:hypothetical protein
MEELLPYGFAEITDGFLGYAILEVGIECCPVELQLFLNALLVKRPLLQW